MPVTATPAPGQIRDVNAHSLAALCRRCGAVVTQAGLVPDDPAALRAAVAALCATQDVVVVSGGSSAGMRDHTVEVFTAGTGGELLCHGVALSPGKPFILARKGDVCLMGLPGHVSSALICAHVFLRPLLRHLQGASEAPRPVPGTPAVLSRPLASAQGRRDYIRVRLEALSPDEQPRDGGSAACALAGRPPHRAVRLHLRSDAGRRPRGLPGEPRGPLWRRDRGGGTAGRPVLIPPSAIRPRPAASLLFC